MPALTVPLCGYCVGSRPQVDAGIARKIAYGGAQVGFSDYDSVRRVHTLVFDTCTEAEKNTIYNEYLTNRLTGAMTFTPPWVGASVNTDYADEPAIEPLQGLYYRITLVMRER
jgi:hypothetical protein